MINNIELSFFYHIILKNQQKTPEFLPLEFTSHSSDFLHLTFTPKNASTARTSNVIIILFLF